MNLTIELVVIVVMLGINAIFAAYEMALAAISMDRLKSLVSAGSRGAATALTMKERMGRSLAVVQVGITLAGSIAAATGGAGVEEFMSPRLAAAFDLSPGSADAIALVLFVLPLSAATILFGELIPKTIALRNQEFVALALSPLMMALSAVLYPAVRVLELAVEAIVRVLPKPRHKGGEAADDAMALRELVDTAAAARSARLIGRLEEHVVKSISLFPTRKVREMLIPLKDTVVIPENSSLADALVTAHLHMHTRYPVCRNVEDKTSITGYVNFKDIISALRMNPKQRGVAGIVRPLPRLSGDMTLSNALDYLLRGGLHIAVVVDGADRVQGLVTLEDLVEQLVGSIRDEYDRQPAHLYAMGGQWIAGGGVTMETLRKAMGLAPVPGAERLQDWCIAKQQGPVGAGTIVGDDELVVEVRKVRRGNIMEAIVRLNDQPERSAATS